MKQSLRNFKKVDVSIIIVNYNTEKLTLCCIESVINSIKELKYEIIIVDNASTDGTIKAIRKFQISNPKIKLKIIENDKNIGFAKANNQGIRIAQGRYILLLNSDTVVKGDAIEKLVKFADKKKNVGVVVPKLLNSNGSTQSSVFRFPTISRAIKQYFHGEKELLDKYHPKGNKPCAVESAVMAAYLITPCALENVGLLDEKYFMYFEDLDYCRRIKANGLKIYYLPTSKIVHKHGASGKKVGDKKQFKRLNQSSKIYHGLVGHYVFNFVLWSGQKWQRLLKKGK